MLGGSTTIIIPVYNGYQFTKDCLDSISENINNYKIVLIDNGSTDETIDLQEDWIEVIRNDNNLGYPHAINQGFKLVDTEFCCLLNNDIITTPGFLDVLISHLDKYDIVSCITNYSSGIQRKTIPTYNSKEELYESSNNWCEKHKGESIEVTYVIGFCILFKSELIQKVGEFDESVWPSSGEELDWCWRARELGYKIGVAKDVYLHHFGSQTFRLMQNVGLTDYHQVCERSSDNLRKKWEDKLGSKLFNQTIPLKKEVSKNEDK